LACIELALLCDINIDMVDKIYPMSVDRRFVISMEDGQRAVIIRRDDRKFVTFLPGRWAELRQTLDKIECKSPAADQWS